MSKSPFIPFPHCLRCPISQPCALARLPSWDRWLIPTEGFKEASGLSHIPHPLPVQPGLPYPRMPGSQVGLEGSLLSLPLPASHWTYNSGTEPCSRCPPNLVLEGDKPRRARDPPTPDLERREVGILAFSGSGSAFLLLHVPAPPLHLTLPFHISLYFAFLFVALNLCCCLSWVSLAPPWPREEEGECPTPITPPPPRLLLL